MKPIKFNSSGILQLVLGLLTVAEFVLSSKAESNNRQKLKDELKAEILKDLNPGN